MFFRYGKKYAKRIPCFNNSFFISKCYIKKHSRDFLNSAVPSKKIHICKYGNVIQYSWNVVLFSSLLLQFLFKLNFNNNNNNNNNNQLNFFLFFETWKTGFSENEADSKVLPSIIYNSHLWLFISVLNKDKYSYASNKQRWRWLIFRSFPTRWSLLRFALGNQRFLVQVYISLLLLLIFRVCKVWNHFSFLNIAYA